jgi:hypothetical protein
MKNKNFILLILLSWIGLYACKKDPPPNVYPPPVDYTKLPPETQTGANTFGCLVDGKVWVPRVPLLAVTYQDISALISEKNGTGSGGVSCNLVDLETQQDNSLSLTIGKTLFETGKFCDPLIGVGMQFKDTNGKWYQSNYHHQSQNCVTITRFDTTNNIISGTFNFVVYDDTIHIERKIVISDGRFDVKYAQQ